MFNTLTINELFAHARDVAIGGGTRKTWVDIMSAKHAELTHLAIKRAVNKSPETATSDYWNTQYARLTNELKEQEKKARSESNLTSLAKITAGQKMVKFARSTGGSGKSKADQIMDLFAAIDDKIAADAKAKADAEAKAEADSLAAQDKIESKLE